MTPWKENRRVKWERDEQKDKRKGKEKEKVKMIMWTIHENNIS